MVDLNTDDESIVDLDETDPNPREVEENSDPLVEEFYSVNYKITSYGADYPVDGLVKRLKSGAIFIPTFQRGYVWNIFRASRFIESLLLGLPVPAIFLSKEADSNKLLVIDGQQRLKTLQYFYNGVFEPQSVQFKLKGVNPSFVDRTYSTLDENDRIKIDDSILHAIIVQQEEPENDGYDGQSSIYHIFERLNTGGVLLQPQEIRSCISYGPFSQLLLRLNVNKNWRSLFGKVSARMRDQELILRFLALYFDGKHYTKPMKEFLNRFMAKHRTLSNVGIAAEFERVFSETVESILMNLGANAFRRTRSVNAALCDSVMVGMARRLMAGPVVDPTQFAIKFSELLSSPTFQVYILSGTTDEFALRGRINEATQLFSTVK